MRPSEALSALPADDPPVTRQARAASFPIEA